MKNYFTKRMIIAGFIFALVILAYLLFNYSFLQISGSGGNKMTIFLRTSGGTKNFIISDKPRTILIKRGELSIEASKGEQSTVYNIKPGLIFDKAGVEVEPQKAASFRGESQYGCSAETKPEIIYYFPCLGDAKDGLDVAANGKIQRLIGPPADENNSSDTESTATAIVKLYGEELIEAKLDGSNVTIRKRGLSGYAAGQQTTVKDFSGNLSNSSFAVSTNGESFAIFDDSKNIFHYFDSIDSSAKSVSVKLDNKYRYFSSIDLTKNYGYVLSKAYGSENSKDNKGSGENSPGIFLSSIDLVKGRAAKKLTLPRDWTVKKTSPFGDNSLLILLSGYGGNFVLENGTELEKLGILSDINDVCVSGSNSLYLVSDSNRSIYEYRIDKKAAFLAYKTIANTISGLSCSISGASFTLSNPRDGLRGGYLHYALEQSSYEGTRRIEDLLPLYFNADKASVIKVQQAPGTNNVWADVLTGKIGDSALREKTKLFLSSKGLDSGKTRVKIKR